MEKLSIQDITILIEAVDAWKNRKVSAQILDGMLDIMLSPSKEEYDKKQEERKLKKKEAAVKAEGEKDEADILKAKLIILKKEMYSEISSQL